MINDEGDVPRKREADGAKESSAVIVHRTALDDDDGNGDGANDEDNGG